MTRKLLAVFGIAMLCYGIWVYAWSVPIDESNRANLILGGCESGSAAARGTWSPVQKAIPPFVRCVVRFFRKEQILNARFRFAAVGRPGWPPRPSYDAMTPVQFYVLLGGWQIKHPSASVEIDNAMYDVVLGSLNWLIESGADPNQCSPEGLIALHIAANRKRRDLFDNWVALGASPDIECDGGDPQDSSGPPSEWLENAEQHSNNALHLQTTPVIILAYATIAPYASFKLA